MANWQRAIDFVLAHEGGYVPASANDPGGETNYGIAKRYHPELDIKKMSRDMAIEIYNKEYWRTCRCEILSDDLALAVLDTAVNCGCSKALHWLSECHQEVDRFIEMREIYYSHLGESAIYSKYLKGWMNRIKDLRKNISLSKG